MSVQRGTRLGPYEILAPLGRGGMGEVWEARDDRLGRAVALKVLPAEVAGDSERLARLLSEARLASALNHPNVVTVYDVGSEGGVAWLAMERVAGGTLRELLAKGALPLRQALALAAQVAEGLARAHAAGIVHRDLKPENVMAADDGHVKILDFGLAKRAALADRPDLPTAPLLTAEGQLLGTFAYMSPEQLADRPVDFRSDQFALGVLLYEMLAGRRPFAGASPTETVAAILRDDPAPLPAAVPAPVRWVVERCLAKEPAARYAATDDLARDLRTLRDRIAEHLPSAPVAPPARARRRGAWRAALLGAAAVALPLLLLGVRARLAPRAGAPGTVRVTQLTSGGREYEAALSPDGRTIAYRSEEGDSPDLYVRQVSGGEAVRLTHDEAVESDMAWAPDGESLYYVTDADGSPVIWRIGALGGTPRKVVAGARYPAPSHDGRIAWVRTRGAAGEPLVRWVLEVAGPDGSSAVALHAGDTLGAPAFSPDGTSIAITEGGLFVARPLLLVDPKTGRTRALTRPEDGSAFGAAWLPDGRRLVVSIGGDRFVLATGLDLAVVSLDGAPIRRFLPNVDTRFALPSISADGRRLVASMEKVQRELWKAPLDGTPEENGRRAVRLLGADWSPFWADVSRDGRQVLFDSRAKGSWNLHVAPVDGSAPPRQVTFLSGNDVMHSSFSPDGKRIAYASQQDGPSHVWVADVDGGNARQITHGSAPEFWPVWTRDGGSILYATGPADALAVYRVPAAGGTPVRLPGTEGLLRGDASPVDDRMVFCGAPDVVKLLDGSGRTLASVPAPAILRCVPVFAPDGRSFTVLKDERYKNRAVWSVDAATGETKPLVRFPGSFVMIFRASYADAGRSIVVNRLDTTSNVVLVEGF